MPADVKRAFKRDDPAERSAGLRAARAGVGQADRKERNRAAAAVEKALKKEPAPDVRKAALDLLLALRTERSLDRLIVGVLDRDEAVVAHVHAIVRDHADPALHRAIVRALKEDASWRFRASMVDLLLTGAREAALPPLRAALADPHPGVAARAAEALERLTSQAFGLDEAKWREYFASRKPKESKPGERRTTAEQRKVEDVYEGPIRGLLPTLYTVPIVRKRVIFVVDMSSSMHKTSRSSHFTELKRAIFGLPSDVFFNVLCFDQRMFFFTKAKSLAPATSANKAAVERWMNDLPAGQRTDVHQSVAAGLAMLHEALKADAAAQAELFILTDGHETAKTTSLRVVEAQYQRLPRDRCRVHLVALGRQGTPVLRTLAQQSGGMFVEVPGR